MMHSAPIARIIRQVVGSRSGRFLSAAAVAACTGAAGMTSARAAEAAVASYRESVLPILESACYECHGDSAKNGGVALDGYPDEASLLADADLWHRVLKNVRAGLMPPPDSDQPTDDERAHLQRWIKSDVFGLDPDRADPGRPVLRRLNRTEYRNTIRDLTGVDFRTDEEFPADDTGHGFDTIGEVLTLSPMLLEKYLDAARTIVAQAVPIPASPAPDAPAADPPANYRRWFPQDPPADDAGRRTYARERLDAFAGHSPMTPPTD